jgi:glycine cleavage system transcriptional repressor
MEYLALSILASKQPDITNELCKLAAQCGCHIIDSRMTHLGAEFSANLLLRGSWNTIAKFEAGFSGLEQKYELRSMMRRTKPATAENDRLPYQIFVISPEQAGVAAKLTQFFTDHALVIQDLYVNTYKAPTTETPMLSVTLTIHLAKNQLIADLREEFMLFCDAHNLDAVMEPQKS